MLSDGFSQVVEDIQYKPRAKSYIVLTNSIIELKKGKGQQEGCTETDRFVRNRTLMVI